MAEPTTLINAFLDAELLAGVAVWNEPDDSRYRELQAEMLRYVSADLAGRIRSVRADNAAEGSDHQPLWLEIDL